MWGIEQNDAYATAFFPGGFPSKSVHITQMKLGATVSKTFNNTTPYISGTFNYDLGAGGSAPTIPGGCIPPACIEPEKYKYDLQLIGGANWNYKSGVTAGLEAGGRIGRENFTEFVLNANFRVDL